ncbi:MAG: DUF2784 family protein [Spirochaetales bacterium]|nr:DUF2784 family protein [Spirochaetales bacterium]
MYNIFAQMPRGLLESLDLFFFVFHTLFTLFNLTGWLWRPARNLHLITMGLTAFSWLVLGIFYGFGYCFCTEWHWLIRHILGYRDSSSSYIHLLLGEVFGLWIEETTVIEGTKWAFILIIAGMIAVRVIDKHVSRRE